MTWNFALVLDKPSDDADLMTLDQEALFVQKTVLFGMEK
jgi:hypothetical protein